MRHVQLTATLVQRDVDQVLVPVVVPVVSLGDPRPPSMHQDVLAEVLGGQAQVDEGGAKGQRVGQLEQGKVVVMAISMETVVDVDCPNRDEHLVVA